MLKLKRFLYCIVLSLLCIVNSNANNKDYKLLLEQATKHAINGNTDSAIYYSNEACQLAIVANDTSAQVKALNVNAMSQLQLGNTELSIELFNKAILLAKQHGDTLLQSNSMQNLSTVYSSTGISDFPKALEILLETVKLQESLKAWNTLPATYKNISVIFKEMGNVADREIYLQKALKLIRDDLVTNVSIKAMVFNELGRFYTDENINYAKADSFYTEVLTICEKIGWKKGIAVSLNNKASIHEKEGDFEQAIKLQKQALVLKEEMKDLYGIVNSNHSLGDIFLKQGVYSKAIQHLTKAKKIAEEQDMTNLLNNIYFSLYQTYRANHDYKTSLLYHEKYMSLSDSIKGEGHKNIVEEYKTKYETEKKEQEIVQLTQEKEIAKLKSQKKLRNYFILSVVLIFGIFGILIIARQNRIKAGNRESNLNQKLLRSQMNPHFIFNSLNSINSFILDNKPQEASNFLLRFSKLMRNILQSSRNEYTSLETEIASIENYLQLEQLRFKDNLHYTIDVEKEIEIEEIEIPPMLIQPYIENSIKHAFHENMEGEIKIAFNMENEAVLRCELTDNGIGIESTEESKKDHVSYAMQITQERLEILNQKRKNNIIFKLTDLKHEGKQGTKVVFTIPV